MEFRVGFSALHNENFQLGSIGFQAFLFWVLACAARSVFAGFLKPAHIFMNSMRRLLFLAIPLLAALLSSGCSIKKIAINQMGNALSGGGDVFASDDDPELIRDALPFSLKLMESVLDGTPEHEGLLTSLTSGFTQYSYGFVQMDADEIEDDDFEEAERLRARAIAYAPLQLCVVAQPSLVRKRCALLQQRGLKLCSLRFYLQFF